LKRLRGQVVSPPEIHPVVPAIRAQAAYAAKAVESFPTLTIDCRPLPNEQVVALHLGQVLGNSRPRGTDNARKVLVAEGDSQQGAARIFNAEVLAQIEHRAGDAFVEIEVEQPGGAAQKPILMPQIVLMKFSESRFAAVQG
jgi:hypothetical protein